MIFITKISQHRMYNVSVVAAVLRVVLTVRVQLTVRVVRVLYVSERAEVQDVLQTIGQHASRSRQLRLCGQSVSQSVASHIPPSPHTPV